MLYQNQFYTDTLPAGSALSITSTGTGLVTFTSPGQITKQVSISSSTTLGPFQYDQLYRVSCLSGTINLTEVLSDAANSVATLATDLFGNVTGLVGPGGGLFIAASTNPVTGGSVFSFSSGLLPGKVANTIVLLGDSLSMLCGGPVYSAAVAPTDFIKFTSGTHYYNTAENTYYTSNGSSWSATPAGAEADGHSNVSWLMHGAQKAFQPLRVIRNAGVTGQTSMQILARFADDVTALAPALVSIFAGANDPNAGVSAATTIANIRAMVDKALAARIIPIVGTVWPNNVINTAAELETLDTINRYIRTLDNIAGVYVWDGFSAISSGSNSYPGATILYDGTHQAPQGAMLAGYQFAKPLAKMPFIAQTLPDVSTNSTRNLCYNGAAYATTGGGNVSGTNGWSVAGALTGVGPDGWDTGTLGTWGSDTVVASITAPTDGNGGNWSAYTVTAVSGSTDGHAIYAQISTSLAAMARTQAYQLGDSRVEGGNRYVCVANGTTAGSAPIFDTTIGATTIDNTVTWKRVENIVAGDEIEFAYEYEMDATLAAAGVFVAGYVEIYVSGSKILQIGSTYSKAGFPTLHPTKGIFTAPPVKIPANCTSIIHYARVYLKAGAAGLFKMRAMSSFKTI